MCAGRPQKFGGRPTSSDFSSLASKRPPCYGPIKASSSPLATRACAITVGSWRAAFQICVQLSEPHRHSRLASELRWQRSSPDTLRGRSAVRKEAIRRARPRTRGSVHPFVQLTRSTDEHHRFRLPGNCRCADAGARGYYRAGISVFSK